MKILKTAAGYALVAAPGLGLSLLSLPFASPTVLLVAAVTVAICVPCFAVGAAIGWVLCGD